MTALQYMTLKRAVIEAGYAHEVDWAYDLKSCRDAATFRDEYCWVVLNSGMKEQIARKIWQRVRAAKEQNLSASEVFGHKQKAAAIDRMWQMCSLCFSEYTVAADKISFLRQQPFVGPITVWHLAKNLGVDVCKPDRHLVRIAGTFSTTPQKLCEKLRDETSDRVNVVDTVIWRAANLGMI